MNSQRMKLVGHATATLTVQRLCPSMAGVKDFRARTLVQGSRDGQRRVVFVAGRGSTRWSVIFTLRGVGFVVMMEGINGDIS